MREIAFEALAVGVRNGCNKNDLGELAVKISPFSGFLPAPDAYDWAKIESSSVCEKFPLLRIHEECITNPGLKDA